MEAVEMDASMAACEAALHPGPYVRLIIRDTGVGMTPDIVERIFEPFFTTKGVGEETGMGLAVVHGIVASHGGAITVESTPGVGTAFTVYLPRVAATVPGEAWKGDLIPHGHGCILFVDDEEPLARLSHAFLERLGYEVVSHTSSLEAREALRADPQRFDLVVTDQTMPEMTGEQLARELRHMRPDIPIILCTGFSHVMNADKAQTMGIDAFCMKPLVARDLGLVVHQVLVQRRRPGS